MRILWHGHACFTVEQEGYRVVFDPFADDTVPGYKNLSLEAEAVFCTHGHSDHNAVDRVSLTGGKESPFEVEEIAVYHDEEKGALRGENRIYILKTGDVKVCHMGDLGHELSAEQYEKIGCPDVLMIPVGGHFTIDGKTAAAIAEKLGARVVIPMHYRNGELGYGLISEINPFLDEIAPEKIKKYDSNSIEVLPETEAQVAVLTYKA